MPTRPEAIYRRFAWNAEHTYSNRIALPLSRRASTGATCAARSASLLDCCSVGLFGDYRRNFWRMAGPALRAGRIEELIHVGIVAHHMIRLRATAAKGARTPHSTPTG